MKDLFLGYARQGAMTIDELATVLRRKPSWVRSHSAGERPLIPRLPGKPIRFDPVAMIEVFCKSPEAQKQRSLTIERHKTGAKPIGGYRKCL